MRISKGCFNCIARKVKCDETKPDCLRCTKYGRWCPGYRNHDQLMFRHTLISPDDPAIAQSGGTQKVMAEQSEQGHHGFVERHTDINDALAHRIVEDQACEALVNLKRWGPTIQDEAVARFFSAWVQPLWSKHNYGGWLYFLPDFYASKTANSCLAITTKAISLTHMGNIRNDGDLVDQGCALYGKALIAVRQALVPAMLRTNNDEILVSIFLLALYELINKTEGQPQPWYFHIMGASTLLKKTSPSIDFSSDIGKHMLRLIHTQVLTLAMRKIVISCAHGVEVSPTLSAMKPRYLDQNDPSTCLRLISIDVVAIGEKVERLVDDFDTTSLVKASDLIHELVEIDTRLIKWLEELSGDWNYQVISSVSSDRYPTETRVFQNRWVASNRNFQSSCRILLHHIFMELIHNLVHHEVLSNGCEELLASSEAIIRESADNICSTVPYTLGEHSHKIVDYELDGTCVGAYMLMWPMHLVARSRCVPEDQRLWVRDLLREKIGKKLGIRAALVNMGERYTLLLPPLKSKMLKASSACSQQSYSQ